MEVHKILGSTFQEVVYQRALSVEMNLLGFLVANEISVEIKAIVNLEDVQ